MKEYFIKRREKFIATLPAGSVALLFSGLKKNISEDLDYPFIVNKNFYYLTGLNEDNCIYMLVKGESNYKEFFFTEERSKEREMWIGPRLKRHEIEDISGLSTIYSLNDFDRVLSCYLNIGNQSIYGEIDSVYFNLARKSINNFETVDEIYAKRIKETYSNIYVRSLYNNISKLRMIKDDFEIENICKAISITKDGIYEMMKHAKECNYEYEIESFYTWRLKYHNTTESFKTICASGINATILHYESNNSEALNNNLVLCDLGSLQNNYASDISRTFPKNGKFTDLQKQIYSIVLDANKKSIEFLAPGVSRNDYENFGRSILAKGLMDLKIIDKEEDIDKYYFHSLGHLLGLDVHDVGCFKEFKEGMIVTCEPGLYIPELKIGIRIEDDILITKDGRKNLSSDIIKEIDEIEKLMND